MTLTRPTPHRAGRGRVEFASDLAGRRDEETRGALAETRGVIAGWIGARPVAGLAIGAAVGVTVGWLLKRR